MTILWDAEFEFALDLILDGLDRTRRAASTSPGKS